MTESLTTHKLPPLRQQIFEETDVMLRHALSLGLRVSGDMPQRLESYRDLENGKDLADLTRLHSQLSEMVAPATPLSLLYLEKEHLRQGTFGFLGQVSLVRQLTAISIFSMVALFALSLSTSVNGEGKNFSLFSNSGMSLLLNELFLLSAASIGVSFANLYVAHLYLRDNTFDPRYEPSYWVRYVLGLMSGTILAFLIPIDHWLEGSSQAGALHLHGMGKPTLALLGGFSAQAIYRILFKMVNAIESVVRGSAQESLETEKAQVRLDAERRELQTKAELSDRLRKVRDEVPPDHPAADSLTRMANDLSGLHTPEPTPQQAASNGDETAEPDAAKEDHPS